MWIIVLCLLLGYGVGYFLKVSDKVIKTNSRVQTACLILLIFTMGLGIGVDKQVLENLPALGGKAVVFAMATIIGSALVVYLFSFVIEKKEAKK